MSWVWRTSGSAGAASRRREALENFRRYRRSGLRTPRYELRFGRSNPRVSRPRQLIARSRLRLRSARVRFSRPGLRRPCRKGDFSSSKRPFSRPERAFSRFLGKKLQQQPPYFERITGITAREARAEPTGDVLGSAPSGHRKSYSRQPRRAGLPASHWRKRTGSRVGCPWRRG